MNFIGIDPGKKGAIAVIREDGSIASCTFDECEYLKILSSHALNGVAAIEDVHAMPRQGVTSMFNFGFNKGWIMGVLYALSIPTERVSVQRWKKMFSLDSDKDKSIELAKRLFPAANLFATPRCKKPSDGIAEALLIAEYERRVYLGS